MKISKLLAVCLISLLLSIISLTPTARAFNAFSNACGGGSGAASTVCRNQTQVNNPVTGSGSIFEHIINLVTLVTGIIAVIVIIVSGIRFATSSGDPNSLTQARNTILYTVIGLVVLLLARSIIVFVINRL
jgi:hypothetical protein